MATTDSRPVPLYNTAFRAYFGIYTTAGILQSAAASVVSTVIQDGTSGTSNGTVTEVGTTGVYYLELLDTEMDTDCSVIKVTATGCTPVVIALYPQNTGDIKTDIQSIAGQTGGVAAMRRAFENMIVITANGTPTSTTLTNATLTSSTTDKYKGRPLYYLTGNLVGEIVEVTAYNGSTKTLTHTAAPSGLSATAGDLALLA